MPPAFAANSGAPGRDIQLWLNCRGAQLLVNPVKTSGLVHRGAVRKAKRPATQCKIFFIYLPQKLFHHTQCKGWKFMEAVLGRGAGNNLSTQIRCQLLWRELKKEQREASCLRAPELNLQCTVTSVPIPPKCHTFLSRELPAGSKQLICRPDSPGRKAANITPAIIRADTSGEATCG